MSLEPRVLVKPKAYEAMGKQATEEMIKADQRIITAIKEGIVDRGKEQLKAKSPYNKKNLPSENPTREPEFELDDIKFGIKTTVQVVNPKYEVVFSKIIGCLEYVVNNWRKGDRADQIRTYPVEIIGNGEGKTTEKSAFIEWNHLMWHSLWYISRETLLDTVTEIETIKPPAEYEGMDLSTLVVPITDTEGFDIYQPGSAKVWYLAKRFLDEVMQETVEPVKKEMVKRAEGKNEHAEQFERWLYSVEKISSPRRQLGKVINLLFRIPQKDKPKGSTTLPVVPNEENYLKLLETYREQLPSSLEQWKYKSGKKKGEYKYEGKIGELITFYYELEEGSWLNDDARVLGQFPYIPQYQVKRDGDKMFLSIQALYDRMKALETDYVKGRQLTKHKIECIV